MTAHTPSEAQAVARVGRLRGFHSGAREFDDAPVAVQGVLPDWLQGNLLLNGPALWDLPKGGYRHWFDGLAMLHRIGLGQGEPRYRSRYLRSDDHDQSVAAGRPALAGFGTPDPETFWQRMRHFGKPGMTDNAAVVMSRLDGQWIAQTETPLVIAFDPQTLETLGHVRFDDQEVIHLMAAHGITEADGTYWNVGVELGPKCTYKVFRVVPGGRRREVIGRFTVPKSGYLHALALTPKHAVVWEPAMRAQPLKLLLSGNSYIDNFRWEPQRGSRINLVSRADGTVRSWNIPPMTAFHAVQAYEDGEDTVLELCTAEPTVFDALSLQALRGAVPFLVPHRVLRYCLQAGRTDATPEEIATGVELPMVHGGYWTRQRARWAWSTGFSPAGAIFDRTVKLDLEQRRVDATWQRGDAIQMEPLYVARPGSTEENDGVLMVPTLADHDAGTVLTVLDPASMAPIATLTLPQVVPFGFHAAWAQA